MCQVYTGQLHKALSGGGVTHLCDTVSEIYGVCWLVHSGVHTLEVGLTGHHLQLCVPELQVDRLVSGVEVLVDKGAKVGPTMKAAAFAVCQNVKMSKCQALQNPCNPASSRNASSSATPIQSTAVTCAFNSTSVLTDNLCW